MRQIEKTMEQLIAAHQPGYALDRRFYVDPEIYALEIDRIIMRNWIVAGHQSELREPGDFKVLRVANESAIIVRGSDNELRAFANVCRHRGSVVCLKNKGSTTKFRCPYHGWTYDIDGNLMAARNMSAEFDGSKFGLAQVSVQTWQSRTSPRRSILVKPTMLSLHGPVKRWAGICMAILRMMA